MPNLQQALEDWAGILGPEAVETDQETLSAAQTATFRTSQRVPAVIHPASRSDVQQCMKVAGTHGVSIYPLSGGKNWGLGSGVPVRDGCVVMALDRMDRIVDYDEKLAYITVEPGVTFRQAKEYLRVKHSSLFPSVIGGPPDSSMVGNAIERGDGIGPLGDRFLNACAIEVVLPNGECIHTGFERYAQAKVRKVSRWGVGPHLDGLFSQSNLGVVTQMTFWLTLTPRCFQSFVMAVKETSQLLRLVDTLRWLQAQGVVRNNSIALWNSHKTVASEQQYPWKLTAGRTPLSLETLQALDSPWKKYEWIGVGALYCASRDHVKADRRLLKKSLRREVDRLLFFDQTRARLLKFLHHPLRWISGIDVEDIVRILYKESIFLGFPTERSIKSTYWRKKSSLPENMDPDRDNCGVVWLCPVLPFDSYEVKRAIDIVKETAEKYRFEPQIAFMFPSERAVYLYPSIVYDRDVLGEDERALKCHEEMLNRMIGDGYFPHRLGIQSMAALPKSMDGYDAFIRQIKKLVDPHDILSPGRYICTPHQEVVENPQSTAGLPSKVGIGR